MAVGLLWTAIKLWEKMARCRINSKKEDGAVVVLFYGIIAIHDIPHIIAKSRDHPHQDAIHAAGWVSLFTLHASCGSGRWRTDPSGAGASPSRRTDITSARPLRSSRTCVSA